MAFILRLGISNQVPVWIVPNCSSLQKKTTIKANFVVPFSRSTNYCKKWIINDFSELKPKLWIESWKCSFSSVPTFLVIVKVMVGVNSLDRIPSLDATRTSPLWASTIVIAQICLKPKVMQDKPGQPMRRDMDVEYIRSSGWCSCVSWHPAASSCLGYAMSSDQRRISDSTGKFKAIQIQYRISKFPESNPESKSQPKPKPIMVSEG